jgi:hypothetical protein
MRKSRALFLVNQAITRGESLTPQSVSPLAYIDFHGFAESVIRQTFPQSGRLSEYARLKQEQSNTLNDVSLFVGILRLHLDDIEKNLVEGIDDDDNYAWYFVKSNFPTFFTIVSSGIAANLFGWLWKLLYG